jgi:hypothetical protein
MSYRIIGQVAFPVLLVFCLSNAIYAHNIQRNCFIGLNPSITVEPFYKTGEFDVNIVPIVYQQTLTKQIGIRVSTILNYGVRQTSDRISHMGCQIALPFFFNPNNGATTPPQGLFLAPGMGITRNILENHTNEGLWIEPGYNLLVNNKWAVIFGAQLGATYFRYDNGTKKWGSHFGIKVIIGRWL